MMGYLNLLSRVLLILLIGGAGCGLMTALRIGLRCIRRYYRVVEMQFPIVFFESTTRSPLLVTTPHCISEGLENGQCILRHRAGLAPTPKSAHKSPRLSQRNNSESILKTEQRHSNVFQRQSHVFEKAMRYEAHSTNHYERHG
jgi:hypothetical protein